MSIQRPITLGRRLMNVKMTLCEYRVGSVYMGRVFSLSNGLSLVAYLKNFETVDIQHTNDLFTISSWRRLVVCESKALQINYQETGFHEA